jgi:hypothetical protein
MAWFSMRGRPCLVAVYACRDLVVTSGLAWAEHRSAGPFDQQIQRTGGV